MLTLMETIDIVSGIKRTDIKKYDIYASMTLDKPYIRDTILNSNIYTYIDSIEHNNNIEYHIDNTSSIKEKYNNIIRPHIDSIIRNNNNTIVARPDTEHDLGETYYFIDIYNTNGFLLRYIYSNRDGYKESEYELTELDYGIEEQNDNIIYHLDIINHILSK